MIERKEELRERQKDIERGEIWKRRERDRKMVIVIEKE